ncbi:MAG: FtsX-like permease family protein [Spirochaetaceae bacterium]|nr:FtsX-like permease family protein [Spirochaetaceae bacterium]
MIFLIALRNILRNKKNSASIVLLIGVITALFFIGNSITGNGSRGLRRSFVDNITGDILIEEKGEVTMNLFGANTPIIDNYFTVPVLSAHSALVEYLQAFPEVSHVVSQVSGSAALEVLGTKEAALLCGVDGDAYFDAFPGIALLEGRFLRSGEFGAMVTAEKAQAIEKRAGQKLRIGEPLLFTNAGETGFKIREAPLVGIYRYTNPTAYLNEVVLADAQTVRVLAAVQIATSDVEVDEEALSLLGQGPALDSVFGPGPEGASLGGGVTGEGGGSPTGKGGEEALGGGAAEEGGLSLVDELSGLLAGNSERREAENAAAADGGDWNFIVLRLGANVNADMFTAKIKETLDDHGATAVGWRFAAGSSAIIALLVQMLFNAGVVLVSIACILAVVNILLIAVFRRTKEIGTLRAIGARDRSIRFLVLTENCALGGTAGILGVMLGILILAMVNGLHIRLSNELLSSLLGGEILHIAFSPPLALLSLLVALVLSVLSSLYPVEMAVKIAPIVAVQNG